MKSILTNLLSFNDSLLIRIVYYFFVAYKHAFWIIIFYQIGFSISKNLQDTECRICYFPFFTDRQCTGNCLNTGINCSPFPKHRTQDLRRQSCKNIRFYSTSHTICKNNNTGIFCFQYFDFISTQFFTILVKTFPANIYTYTHLNPLRHPESNLST